VLPYLDIPVPARLADRAEGDAPPAHQEKTLERIRAGARSAPDLAIRSTFIVGFPGETEQDFELLLDWMKQAKLERVGCFRYEPVGGAPANDLGAPVAPEVKDERWHRFMQVQQEISARLLKARSASACPSSSTSPGPTVSRGRSKYDAPEIDGSVYVSSRRPSRSGDIVTAKIERADAYDLHGMAV
jgi:ribosomal protein S12 methylthiotransferase